MNKKKLYKSFITKSKIECNLDINNSKDQLIKYYNENDKDNFALNYFYKNKEFIEKDNNFEINIINMKDIYKGLLRKNNKIIRMNYLRKLDILNNKEKENRKIQNIIILDWDDTLLCTSFLVSKNFYNNSNLEFNSDDKNKINLLDELITELLTKSVKNGNLYIITNAKEGWVQYSAKVYNN